MEHDRESWEHGQLDHGLHAYNPTGLSEQAEDDPNSYNRDERPLFLTETRKHGIDVWLYLRHEVTQPGFDDHGCGTSGPVGRLRHP